MLRGALDKYNTYLFCSKENFEINQYQNFSWFNQCVFILFEFFVNSIISRVSHKQLHCAFIEISFKK